MTASAEDVVAALEACVSKSIDEKKDALRALTVSGPLPPLRAPRTPGGARARQTVCGSARGHPLEPRPARSSLRPPQALIDPTDESYEVQKEAAGERWPRVGRLRQQPWPAATAPERSPLVPALNLLASIPAPNARTRPGRILPGVLMQLLEDDEEGVAVEAASALAALADHSGSVRDKVSGAHFASTHEKVVLNPVQDEVGEMEGVFG
jgi:hypothetical protein